MATYSVVVAALWVILGGTGASLLIRQFVRGRRASTTSQATKRLLAGLVAVIVLLVGLTLLMGQSYGVVLGGVYEHQHPWQASVQDADTAEVLGV